MDYSSSQPHQPGGGGPTQGEQQLQPIPDETKQRAMGGQFEGGDLENRHHPEYEELKKQQPVQWVRIDYDEENAPRCRHGHRALAFKDVMLVFGGGNDGIFDKLYLYNSLTNQWTEPLIKGEKLPGLAAFAAARHKTAVYFMGGMQEYGKYTNELYELELNKMSCHKLKTRWPKAGARNIPSARIGHSIVITSDKVCFVFGGLTNGSKDSKQNSPIYLNDLFHIDVRNTRVVEWAATTTVGIPPPPRESHSACLLETPARQHMIIYGGMNGVQRLGDVWILDIPSLTWHNPMLHGIPPAPRSLHSACLISERMYIFGGWVPTDRDANGADIEWKCTNSLGCLNVESMQWEHLPVIDGEIPRPRAGHSGVALHNRVYVWSGREGYRKGWNNQICHSDMWFLEIDKPGKPLEKLVLNKSNINSLEVTWAPTPAADAYLVQIQKVVDGPRAFGSTIGYSPMGQRCTAVATVQRGVGGPAGGGQPQLVKFTRQGEPGAPTQILRVVQRGQPLGLQKGAPTTKIIVTKAAGGQGIVGNEQLLYQRVMPQAGGMSGLHHQMGDMADLPGSSTQGGVGQSSLGNDLLQSGSTGLPSISTQGTTYTRPTQGSQQDESDLPHNLLDEPPTPQPQGNNNNNNAEEPPLNPLAAANVPGNEQRHEMEEPMVPQQQVPGQPNELDPREGDHPDPVAMDPAAPPTHIDPADPFPSDVGGPAQGTEGGEAIPADPMSSKTGEPSDPMQSAIDGASGRDPLHQPGFEPRQPAEGDVGEMLDQSMLPQHAATTSSAIQTATSQQSNMPQEMMMQGQAGSGQQAPLPPMQQAVENPWHDVAIVRGQQQLNITHYFAVTEDRILYNYEAYLETGIQAGRSEDHRPIVELQPGTAYRVRYCGINRLGIGPFGDYTILKTSQVGFPGAPSAIKISKVPDGAHLSWEPPLNLGQIVEYSVYLAVRNTGANVGNDNQLAFMRVYAGPQSECVVSQNSLETAYVDASNKPAIIFRIAAKNDKGYGPATQVRWLQDNTNIGVGAAPGGIRPPMGSTAAHTAQFGYYHSTMKQAPQGAHNKKPRMN